MGLLGWNLILISLRTTKYKQGRKQDAAIGSLKEWIFIHLLTPRDGFLAHACIYSDFLPPESQSLFGQIELHQRKDVTPTWLAYLVDLRILWIGWRL